MEIIESVQNPMVKRLRALKNKVDREAENMMLIEGEKLIREAIEAGLSLRYAFIREDLAEGFAALMADVSESGAKCFVSPDRVIKALSDTKSPQGILAALEIPAQMSLSDAPQRLVALDGVQDPGNVGTIWRTADAVGYEGLLLGADCADAFSPKVQRAAMGSGYRVPCASVDLPEALAQMKAQGYRVIATSLGGESLSERPDSGDKTVVVIGSEARGISEAVLALADVRIMIPMRGGAESLNAAVAAGIILYDLTREWGRDEP